MEVESDQVDQKTRSLLCVAGRLQYTHYFLSPQWYLHVLMKGWMAEGVSCYRGTLVSVRGGNREEIARSVQAELDKLDGWCDRYKGRIHPDKASDLWCCLNNHAVRVDMPAVYIEGKELKRKHLRYLDITFDRSLCGSEHITRVIGKAKVAMETMAGARMSQRILVIRIGKKWRVL